MFAIVIILLALAFTGCKEENITQILGPEDWQGPVISWRTQPDPELRGSVGIDFAISDSSEIRSVTTYLDGFPADLAGEVPHRLELITDSLEDGVHVLEVRATDKFDNLGISPILRINVANSVAQGPQLIWVPDHFVRIQDAINAATDFDTIRVRSGTYYETLNTFGKGIWLESELGPTTCSVNGVGSFNTLFVPNGRFSLTVKGFAFSNAEVVVRLDAGATILFANNILGFDTSYTLWLSDASGGTVTNNLFQGSQTSVQISYFWGAFLNNILQNASNIAYWNSALFENPAFHGYNAFWRNAEDYNILASPGIGEFNADPMIDLENRRLVPGSPCINSGHPDYFDLDSTRSDIGPFGGQLAY